MQQRSSVSLLLGESKWEREEGDRGDQHLGTRAEEKREEKETDRQTHRERKEEGRVNI